MANVFGVVVDDEKLDEMSRYIDKEKSQEDRAREAMKLINDAGKNEAARNCLQEFQIGPYGLAGDVFTACYIYNATGDTLHFVCYRDLHGQIGPSPYPLEIGNGQWGAFMHVPPAHETLTDTLGGNDPTRGLESAYKGSHGAVVYRGKNRYGEERDYLIVWSTPDFTIRSPRNRCYSDVGNVGAFDEWRSKDIMTVQNTATSTHKTDKNGCIIQVSIGDEGKSPQCIAELKVPIP